MPGEFSRQRGTQDSSSGDADHSSVSVGIVVPSECMICPSGDNAPLLSGLDSRFQNDAPYVPYADFYFGA